MQCTKPFLLTKNLDKKQYPEGLLVACGSCLNCRKQLARDWAQRIEHESQYAKLKYFVTLTYDDVHCPKCMCVIKKEVQNYIKRLRKNSDSNLKYYACGEYGEKNNRPHYHAIILINDEKHDSAAWQGQIITEGMNVHMTEGLLQQSWGRGNVVVGDVNQKSITYVVEYMDKKILQHYNMVNAGRREPFRLISNGMGLQYIIDNATELHKNKGLKIRDKIVGLPRYYKKKLGISPEQLKQLSKQNEFIELKKYMKKQKIKKLHPHQWDAYYKMRKVQRAKNTEARTMLYRKERSL